MRVFLYPAGQGRDLNGLVAGGMAAIPVADIDEAIEALRDAAR